MKWKSEFCFLFSMIFWLLLTGEALRSYWIVIFKKDVNWKIEWNIFYVIKIWGQETVCLETFLWERNQHTDIYCKHSVVHLLHYIRGCWFKFSLTAPTVLQLQDGHTFFYKTSFEAFMHCIPHFNFACILST